MNDLKELNEILNEMSADEALKESIVKILESEIFNSADDFFINEKYIESADFRRKFAQISDNPALNEALYIYSKEALKHRSGTPYEDMYLFDSGTGKIIFKQTNCPIKRKILRTDELEKALQSRNKVMFHTHPSSAPPSILDFNTAYDYGFGTCYIIGHNGRIFGYTSKQKISKKLYEAYFSEYKVNGFSERIAHVMTLMKLMQSYKIDFWEVE